MTRQAVADALISKGLVTLAEWECAAQENPDSPEQALLQRGLISDVDVAQAKAARWGLEFVRLDGQRPAGDQINPISRDLMSTGLVLPLDVTETTLRVAIADPDKWEIRDALQREANGRHLTLVVTPHIDIQQHSIAAEDTAADDVSVDQDARDMVEAPPVVRMVDLLITRAIAQGASDIHIGNWGSGFEALYRIDGALAPAMHIPRRLFPGVMSRLKVLARLDIAEHRLPQDGEIPWPSRSNRKWDIRVVTLATKRAAHAVLRIFGQHAGNDLSQLGFSADILKELDRLTHVSSGIILATGPTGSGKTTTLATMIRRIKQMRPHDAIYTVEDPVEVVISGAAQIQVNPKADLTFGRLLRTLLRSDPDIILIGEIRDQETAAIAVRAALTGHLVLATLHTNDAPGAVTRLIDMGVEPYLIADVLRAVIAQRLIRRVCDRCRTRVALPEAEGRIGPHTVAEEWRGAGCSACRAGYRGRVAIAEILVKTPQIEQMIMRRSTASELRQAAGMHSLLEDGFDKVRSGLTTLAELRRVALIADVEAAPLPQNIQEVTPLGIRLPSS